MVIVMQWSTWEREEWLHNGIYYQVGASGIDDVPQDLQVMLLFKPKELKQ